MDTSLIVTNKTQYKQVSSADLIATLAHKNIHICEGNYMPLSYHLDYMNTKEYNTEELLEIYHRELDKDIEYLKNDPYLTKTSKIHKRIIVNPRKYPGNTKEFYKIALSSCDIYNYSLSHVYLEIKNTGEDDIHNFNNIFMILYTHEIEDKTFLLTALLKSHINDISIYSESDNNILVEIYNFNYMPDDAYYKHATIDIFIPSNVKNDINIIYDITCSEYCCNSICKNIPYYTTSKFRMLNKSNYVNNIPDIFSTVQFMFLYVI